LTSCWLEPAAAGAAYVRNWEAIARRGAAALVARRRACLDSIVNWRSTVVVVLVFPFDFLEESFNLGLLRKLAV